MKKVVASVAFSFIALILFTQSIHATEIDRRVITLPSDPPITLFWVNASEVKLDLYFSGGSAQCSGKVTGNAGTSKITATFTLERKNSNGTYSFEASWDESISGRTLTFSNSDAVSSGYTYRLSVTAKVTKDGITETVNTSVESKY